MCASRSLCDVSLARRLTLARLALGAGASQFGAAAFADTRWPTKPLRIIVPFAPGGGADVSARVLAELFTPALGQSVIVENRPGAGSVIGVTAAARAKDGHTLLMASNSMVINALSNPQVQYDPAHSFDAIGMVSAQPLVLIVPASSRATNVHELITLAQASPGMTAGNSGNGTLAHLTSVLFAQQTGIQITPVAYKGESALLPEMIGGLVDFGFLNLPSVAPHLQSGRLRALAVSSPQPTDAVPDAPTLSALGYPDLQVQGWAALLAPKDTIAPTGLATLRNLLTQALQAESVKTRFAALRVTPFALSGQDSAQFLRDEARRYASALDLLNKT